MLKQEPSLESLHRSYRSTFYVWFNFKQEPSRDRFTGAIARLSLFCQSIEDPCSVTAICLLFSTVFFDNQSELSVTLVQSGSWTVLLYSRKLVSHPYGGLEHLPHEYWASVNESLLPLNSRRVRFLFLGSLSRPMHSTTKFEKLFQFKCVTHVESTRWHEPHEGTLWERIEPSIDSEFTLL